MPACTSLFDVHEILLTSPSGSQDAANRDYIAALSLSLSYHHLLLDHFRLRSRPHTRLAPSLSHTLCEFSTGPAHSFQYQAPALSSSTSSQPPHKRLCYSPNTISIWRAPPHPPNVGLHVSVRRGALGSASLGTPRISNKAILVLQIQKGQDQLCLQGQPCHL